MRVENGVVEAVKRDNKALNIGGEWYSSFQAFSGINRGDVVSFEYAVKGQWKNIRGAIEIHTGGQVDGQVPASQPSAASQDLPPHYMIARGYMNKVQVFPIPVDHPDRAIVRQNSVTNATALVVGMGYAPDETDVMDRAQEVLEIAVVFEKYSTGQLEMEEALKFIGDGTNSE